MSRILTLELDDEIYALIERQARGRGTSAARWLATALQSSDGLLQRLQAAELNRKNLDQQAARERFESHFGSVDLGHPTGTDNERIDGELAEAYGRL